MGQTIQDAGFDVSSGHVDDSGDLDSKLAVIGMAGRFPGAADVAQLWRNLADGVPGIREVTDAELAAAQVPPGLLADPRFVRRSAPVADLGDFDAAFFGFSPREAEITDPQHRLFLESCWKALEGAGYRPNQVPGKVGVFGGAGFSNYGVRHVAVRPDIMATVTMGQYAIGTLPDSLCTMVAYKLGLTGPVYTVQSACSTSLVAVHVAAQSLLTYECDTALAGGARIEEPLPEGYLYEEGGMASPDGMVRSLDNSAVGTVFGNAVAVVVLKRLADALRDNDHIHAVIRATAVCNDGDNRAGYFAPSMEGQSRVIGDALALAGVDPATIDYVECHATGTRLGDSIELAAVERAFAGPRTERCVLSSIKPDVGHLDRAAGVTSMIKAVLAVEHAVLPATRNFSEPNQALNGAMDRFEVLTADRPWAGRGRPRRAGVNSFGAGGTNVHVVLEQAPAVPADKPDPGPYVLTLSARTPTALATACDELRAYLASDAVAPEELADVAFTLQVSRTGFAYRMAVTVTDLADAIAALADPARARTVGPVRGKAPAQPPADPRAAAELWMAGAEIDWAALHARPRRRLPLPTYPFERKPYFLERVPSFLIGGGSGSAAPGLSGPPGRIPDPAGWFAHPAWRRAPLPPVDVADRVRELGPWWVLADDPLGFAAASRLAELGAAVTVIRPAGSGLASPPHGLPTAEAEPGSRGDFTRLLGELGRPRAVLHTWTLVAGDIVYPEPIAEGFTAAQHRGCYTMQALAGALAETGSGLVDLLVCTDGAVEVTGTDLTFPQHGTLLGLLPSIGQENGDITPRMVDIDVAGCAHAAGGTGALADLLLAELGADTTQPVALRGPDRWLRYYDQLHIDLPSADHRLIGEGATVLITGGLGDVGLVLAEHFAASRGCNLVLTCRTQLPSEETWPKWLEDPASAEDRTARHIRNIIRLRELGADVLAMTADSSDPAEMSKVLAAARERFGPLDAVVHGAGIPTGADYFGPVTALSRAACEAHFESKVGGLRVLADLLDPDEAPVRVTLSSISAVLGGLGHGVYAGANSGMDSLARVLGPTPAGRWLSTNWDTWLVGHTTKETLGATIREYSFDAAEGVDAFERCLSLFGRVGQIVVAAGPLDYRLAQWTEQPSALVSDEPGVRYPRPPLDEPFEEPVGSAEVDMAEIWGEVLCVDKVGANDNFYDLGGHSLAAVRMVPRMRARFGAFPIELMLTTQTVRGCTAALIELNATQGTEGE
jgi:acyl transferase domain-containing protein